LHVCQLAIYSSFKKQEVITNTKRRDSFPVMVHQVVGANLLPRTRKAEQQKIGFKAFGEPQRQ